MGWCMWRIGCAIFLIGAMWETVSGQHQNQVNDALASYRDQKQTISSDQEFQFTDSAGVDLRRRQPTASPSSSDSGNTPGSVSGPPHAENNHAATAASASTPAKPAGKYFKFIVTTPDNAPYAGQLYYIDYKRGIELDTFNSGEYVAVMPPVESSKMAVVFGSFGYKEIWRYIDYRDPSKAKGAFLDKNGAWVIPYKLERLERGDVSVMYNVAFQENAVVMSPTSVTDLNELVRMMKSNPRYVIKVHAHCNERGKRMIKVPRDISDYFGQDECSTITATAKDLTRLRAELIKTYLMRHGIDAGRIKLYPWGSAEMLVRWDGPDAWLNDRIEIEILAD